MDEEEDEDERPPPTLSSDSGPGPCSPYRPCCTILISIQVVLLIGFSVLLIYMICIVNLISESNEREDSLREFPGISAAFLGLLATFINQGIYLKCYKPSWRKVTNLDMVLVMVTFILFSMVNAYQLMYWRVYDHLGLMTLCYLIYCAAVLILTCTFCVTLGRRTQATPTPPASE